MHRPTSRYQLLYYLLGVVIILGFSTCKANLPGHNIKIKVTGVTDSICFLANYYGEKQYYKDTAEVNAQGYIVFEGMDTLPGGVYSVILPGSKYFEFIVNEQHFTLETDSSDYVENMQTTDSDENALFYKYLQLIRIKQKQSKKVRDRIKVLGNDHDSTQGYNDMLATIDVEVNDIRNEIIEEDEDLFVSIMFNAMKDPEIPTFPLLENGRKDSISEYKYYKEHFLDNVDISDSRLLRSPVLHKKVTSYLQKVVVQNPDSLIKEIDMIIERTAGNEETFKYIVSYLISHYEQSKIMGMEAIFVHMAYKYYMTGQVDWIDSTQMAKITERATILRPLLLGSKAKNLVLKDINGIHRSIYEIESDFTVLWFWDPDCGHCKEATPKLAEIYNSHDRKDVEVYSVGIMSELGDWKEFITKNNLNWINVNDAERKVNLRKTYDIYSTPVVFLLDKNKEIIAKRVTVESLEDILKQVIAQEAKKKLE